MRQRLLSPNGNEWMTDLEASGGLEIGNDIWSSYGFTLDYFRRKFTRMVERRNHRQIELTITVFEKYVGVAWEPASR